MSDERSKKKRLLHAGLLVLVAAVAFSMGAVPVRSDNDVWWHLKAGKLIAEGGLPELDPFNHVAAAAGVVWHNHEWLCQWVAWQVHAAGDAVGVGGLRAVILATALLLAATYALLAWFAGRLAGAHLPGVAFALLACEIGRRTFAPRPPVTTYLVLVGLYAFLHGVRVGKVRTRTLLIVVPLLFAIWANVHGGWAAGLVLIAAFAAGAMIDAAGRLFRLAPLTEYPARVIRAAYPWAAALALAILGTLVNPSGIELYAIFGRVLDDPFLVANIFELQPPVVQFTAPFWATLVGAFVLAAVVPRRFPFAAEYFFVPFFAWQAIHHVRHLTLFGLLAAPMLAWYAGEALRSLPAGIAGLARVALLGVVVLWAAWLVALRPDGGTYLQRNAELARGTAYHRANFPAAECDFLLEARLPGRLFNLDFYAGHLIWRLAPEAYQAYSDSRFDVFGGWIAQEANAIIAAEPGWEERLERRGVNLALIPTNKMLALEMEASDAWECVYYRLALRLDPESGRTFWDPNSGWVIFVRRAAVTDEELARATRLFERVREPRDTTLFGYSAP